MYPNAQDVLPLPPRPSLDQYKKRAKDLLKAAQVGESAIHEWTVKWIEDLVALQLDMVQSWNRRAIDHYVRQIESFAKARLLGDDDSGPVRPALTSAQFVIARAHGFASWPKFAAHLESLARASSPVSTFESAADAVVSGDAVTLERLLREHPGLVRTRSTRDHGATLLHYVSANGVENYRQRSPANAAAITSRLLEAGAEVDAEANVYGGGATTLGLVATSAPPEIAGVQIGVIDVLLEHGARMERSGAAGNRHALVRGCLANGQGNAARYLADRGAPLDLIGAAGIGRLDAVETFFDESGHVRATVTEADLREAFAFACGYGHTNVVTFFLDHGVAADAPLRLYGEGHTALHLAAYHAHVDVARQLVARGADVTIADKTWGTPPLAWALTGWHEGANREPGRYYEVAALLVAAGAAVKPEWFDDDKVRADARMLEALRAARPGT